MFRLAFALSVILLVWIQSFFDTTVHAVHGEHHIFAYGWLAWAFWCAFALLLLVFAGVAWRWLGDRAVALLTLVGIPVLAVVVLPQIIYERVELTEVRLIHRREPPHDRFNCNIAFSDMAAVTQEKRETGSFSTCFIVGYHITTHDGVSFELPANTVLTAAHETIDAVLQRKNIPVQVEVVRRPQP